ncbi:hypothetical protein BLS_000705 [Venturia inaequalis]|nr:hypothetical protein BLS_000705 [Venturia inaequalis]KAE9972107.1 hypothetical protein EG328_005175 [Venturia inaequalis]RDI80063.1 hypothetical protein Vi05172_g9883 [Venturia inaequalis]
MSVEEAPERVAVGISFGNSYSSFAYTNTEGKAEVIANEEGDRQIPSILSYVDGEEFQGTQAKAQIVRNSKNTVAFWRDFLGQEFKSIDPTPCHNSAHPIEHNGTIAFSIHDSEAEEPSIVSVSEITTRHLRKLKDSASDFLGKKVDSAVITVPTNFGPAQKEALSKAAAAADLEVLQFISEPVAAVLAYDARPGATTSDKIVVVADLGGIRSDIAVVASRGGIYTVLATSHDFDVNGTKFDDKLMDYFSKEFLKKNKDVGSPMKNERATAKLRLESEAVKKALSLGNSASFSVESLSGGIDFTCTINRLRYELLSGPLFDAVLRLVKQTVEKAELDPLEVTDIILAGGMSHTPKIANNMKNAFPESTVWAPATKSDAINPSELPSRGAAIQASLIADFEIETIRESCEPVVTATPHLEVALGVLTVSDEADKGRFVPLVQAHTPVPVRRTAVIGVPPAGGDFIVKITEASHHIKVSKVEKSATNGGKKDSDDSDDSDDSEEEEEEKREKVWKVGKTIAELAVKGVKKGGKVEVQIDVRPDLGVSIIAREVGAKGGVRGAVDAPKA